jgi:hypothetical protein
VLRKSYLLIGWRRWCDLVFNSHGDICQELFQKSRTWKRQCLETFWQNFSTMNALYLWESVTMHWNNSLIWYRSIWIRMILLWLHNFPTLPCWMLSIPNNESPLQGTWISVSRSRQNLRSQKRCSTSRSGTVAGRNVS